MLDQLVESKSHAGEDRRRGGFMLTILTIAVVGVVTAWGVDLWGKDWNMGAEDLSLTTLVAPVPIPEEEPPPEPEKKQEKEPDVDVRKELIANINQTPPEIPKKIESQKVDFKAMRENVKTMIGSENADTGALVASRDAGVVNQGSTAGLSGSGGTAPTGSEDEAPPPPKPTPKPIPKVQSGGVLNGKATSLPKPAYPAAARAVRASGQVTVQVLISESGSVISANAVGGHPLLRAAAEGAARGARFSPTLLSGQPVKVSGVITYNFVP